MKSKAAVLASKAASRQAREQRRRDTLWPVAFNASELKYLHGSGNKLVWVVARFSINASEWAIANKERGKLYLHVRNADQILSAPEPVFFATVGNWEKHPEIDEIRAALIERRAICITP